DAPNCAPKSASPRYRPMPREVARQDNGSCSPILRELTGNEVQNGIKASAAILSLPHLGVRSKVIIRENFTEAAPRQDGRATPLFRGSRKNCRGPLAQGFLSIGDAPFMT